MNILKFLRLAFELICKSIVHKPYINFYEYRIKLNFLGEYNLSFQSDEETR